MTFIVSIDIKLRVSSYIIQGVFYWHPSIGTDTKPGQFAKENLSQIENFMKIQQLREPLCKKSYRSGV